MLNDRGRERLAPPPPSEPYERFSRIRLSSRQFPHRECLAACGLCDSEQPDIREEERPASFLDAAYQRRHHAFHQAKASTLGSRGRDPSGVCDLLSPRGHCRRFVLLGHGLLASTFLPPFPEPGFAARASHGSRRISTMRALTPGGLAHGRQVSPLTPLCLPGIPSPTTWRVPNVAFSVTSAPRSGHRPSASPYGRRLANTPCRNRFVILRATHSPPVALHPASRRRSYLRLHGA
jgi:hypothetical protein